MISRNYVWYAGYGSNLNKQRFYCYIEGGTPTFGKRASDGCTDKTLPADEQDIILPYELYFALPFNAHGTSNWGDGGVAFLSDTLTESSATRCRLWKITEEQYEEVWGQESKSWYGKPIKLGKIDDCPVWTITHEMPVTRIVRPSVPYLKTIIVGLKETFQMNDREIAEYLVEKRGVEGYYSLEEMAEIASAVSDSGRGE